MSIHYLCKKSKEIFFMTESKKILTESKKSLQFRDIVRQGMQMSTLNRDDARIERITNKHKLIIKKNIKLKLIKNDTTLKIEIKKYNNKFNNNIKIVNIYGLLGNKSGISLKSLVLLSEITGIEVCDLLRE